LLEGLIYDFKEVAYLNEWSKIGFIANDFLIMDVVDRIYFDDV
jgi:hypothetical protein